MKYTSTQSCDKKSWYIHMEMDQITSNKLHLWLNISSI